MYDAIDVARYVINYCNEKGYPISNLRLQKVLYFIQANFIMKTGRICFVDDMECWRYGPVVPAIYRAFRKFCSDSISLPSFKKTNINETDQDLINEVIESTSKKTPNQLVGITHMQSPWKDNYEPNKQKILPISSMYEFFGC